MTSDPQVNWPNGVYSTSAICIAVSRVFSLRRKEPGWKAYAKTLNVYARLWRALDRISMSHSQRLPDSPWSYTLSSNLPENISVNLPPNLSSNIPQNISSNFTTNPTPYALSLYPIPTSLSLYVYQLASRINNIFPPYQIYPLLNPSHTSPLQLTPSLPHFNPTRPLSPPPSLGWTNTSRECACTPTT